MKEIKTYGDLAEEFTNLKYKIKYYNNELNFEKVDIYQEALKKLCKQYGNKLFDVMNLLISVFFIADDLYTISDHSECKSFSKIRFDEYFKELTKLKAELDKEIEKC